MNKKIIVFLLLLGIVVANAYSQENSKTSVPSLVPYTSNQYNEGLQAKIFREKERIKDLGYSDTFKMYIAIREDDIGSCSDNQCRENIEIRYMAESRCQEIKDPDKKIICEALRDNNCQKLTGWRKAYCQNMITGDVATFVKEAAANGKIVTESGISEFLGIYSGYKNYSIIPCQRYMKHSKLAKISCVACKLMLSPDMNKTIDDALTDLALFNLARQDNNYELCASIEDKKIREACQDRKIKNLKILFEETK